jgi:hypothetical protein
MALQVGSTATQEQLHHQQPKHWREMVKSERAKEGEHLHKTEDIKLEGDDDTVSHGTRYQRFVQRLLQQLLKLYHFCFSLLLLVSCVVCSVLSIAHETVVQS